MKFNLDYFESNDRKEELREYQRMYRNRSVFREVNSHWTYIDREGQFNRVSSSQLTREGT